MTPSRAIQIPATRHVAVAALAVFVGYSVLEVFSPDQRFIKVLDTLTFPALGLTLVALGALVTVRAQGRLKVAWRMMTIGLASWAVGAIITAFYEIDEVEAPFPSWADAAYLLYVPCAVVALLIFPSARNWRDQSRMVLDGLIVTGSFFLISWLAVMRTAWHSEGSTGLGFAVSLAYPVGDVLVVTLGFLVLLRAPSGLRLALTLIVAGLASAAVADTVWVYLNDSAARTIGALPDILYVANSLLIIVGLVSAYHAQPVAADEPSPPPSRLALWVPLLPVAVAALTVARVPVDTVLEMPVVVTGAVLIGATLFRQFAESAELVRRGDEIQNLADRLGEELDSASHYVASILPGPLSGPVAVDSRYLPAHSLGGDCFGYTWIDDDHLVVYLIDVSGQGVRSALLSVSVHNLLRSGGFTTDALLAPDRVLSELNARFGMDNHDEHFFTVWYGVYQLSTGVLRYASAGHPPALVLTENDGRIRCVPLEGASMPVGMFADTEFVVQSLTVPAGSRILLYSDGVLGASQDEAELVALCTELGAGQASLLDSLMGGLPSSDDDRSLVLLTFPAPTAGVSAAGVAGSAASVALQQ